MTAEAPSDRHLERTRWPVDAEAVAEWQTDNDHYLAASLHWLRLILAHSATGGAEPVPIEPLAPQPQRRGWWARMFGGRRDDTSGQVPARRALPRQSSVTLDDIAAAAAERTHAAAEMDPPPALELLATQLGLGEFERDLLLLCAAMELDPGTGARCALGHGDSTLAFPTFALAMRMLPGAAWDALSPQGGLRGWQLIEVSQGAGQPLITSTLRADERIVNYIKGLNRLDERIETLVSAAGPRDGVLPELPATLEQAVGEVVRRWHQTAPGAQTPVIQLLGSDGRAKLDVAVRAAAEIGRVLQRLPVELLPTQPHDVDALARLWHREGRLLRIALYIDAQEAGAELDMRPLARFLARSEGAFLLGTREPRAGIERPAATIDVNRARPAEQRDSWQREIGAEAPPGVAEALAAQFDFAPSAIADIVGATRAEAPIGPDANSYERLWDACVTSTRVRLDHLAQRVEPRAEWDDIVLPDPETGLLRQIADQVAFRTRVYEDWGFADRMSRGLGISVLFSGPSGTGKTMAAEVLARHLRLSLYRIDLSAVVSKYIGETEKNLRQLFDAAESGSALLFFDEADALFGKRSEVKDAHDRYANIEVNYLLQRMESYRGLAILATNMRGALDQAFLRRLRFIVTFPFPGVEQRRAIWELAFPAQAMVAGLDYDRLAKLPMTGAMVQNVALNAAFMAARDGTPVSMAVVAEAACSEFRKLDMPLPDAALALAPPPAQPRLGARV